MRKGKWTSDSGEEWEIEYHDTYYNMIQVGGCWKINGVPYGLSKWMEDEADAVQ